MKRYNLIYCLAFLSSVLLPSFAFPGWMDELPEPKWVEFGHNENFTGYIDASNVKGTGNFIRVLSLLDYRVANTSAGKKYLSAKVQHEFNCKEAEARKLYSSLYSGNMGKGEKIGYSYSVEDYEPIQSGSILESIWKIVCP